MPQSKISNNQQATHANRKAQSIYLMRISGYGSPKKMCRIAASRTATELSFASRLKTHFQQASRPSRREITKHNNSSSTRCRRHPAHPLSSSTASLYSAEARNLLNRFSCKRAVDVNVIMRRSGLVGKYIYKCSRF